MIRVWDLGVRLFHWSLVASFATAWFTSEDRGDLHQQVGLAAAGLISFRILWGLAGPRYARFTQFLRSPLTTLSYLIAILRGAESRYIGHNPAGGVMVMALLFSISITAYSGWLMTTDQYFGDDWMQGLHSTAASFTVLLVALHLIGVILASWRHRENLVRAMVTGTKRAPGSGDVA
jgi:cytochrome b